MKHSVIASFASPLFQGPIRILLLQHISHYMTITSSQAPWHHGSFTSIASVLSTGSYTYYIHNKCLNSMSNLIPKLLSTQCRQESIGKQFWLTDRKRDRSEGISAQCEEDFPNGPNAIIICQLYVNKAVRNLIDPPLWQMPHPHPIPDSGTAQLGLGSIWAAKLPPP